MEVPNAEQTASLLSLAVYSFLDPVVFLAYKIPHLSHDQLPPLADYDYTKELKANSFPHLDPFAGGKKQHLFWGLMRTFRREYITLAIMLVVSAGAGFVSPIGIKELLRYVETRGEGATIRPWFWILWLFVGPTVGSLAWQWYIFIATRTLVRAEGILTQLIFEHSLRIRVKAETEPGSSSASPGPSTPSPSGIDYVSSSPLPDDDSEEGSTTAHQGSSTEGTLHASSSSIKSADSKKGQPPQVSETEGSSSADNLVGKINNLVTTDLSNITDARDFLMVTSQNGYRMYK
ncbi:hypothetical protein C0991_009425 [Blastosporella zonata]|nr:hypothetical protein C0991_009425 [Blastosporella zonata]